MEDKNINTTDFERTYETYKEMLLKICILHLKNYSDVQDVLQNTFIKLLYHSPVFESEAHEKRWLIRVAINECKNQQKSFWKRNVDLNDDMLITTQEEDKALLYLVQSLPFAYRNVIHLSYYEKYSITEISDILNISEGAVKMRLRRAREKLKWELEEQ